jgi:hypothetical protein
MILSVCQRFQVGETFSLWKLLLFKGNGEAHEDFGTLQSVLQAGVSFTLFPYENWVSMESNNALLSAYSRGRIFTLCKIDRFSWIDETHISLGTMPFVLEAGLSSTEFPCEKCISWHKEYSLSSATSSWSNIHFMKKNLFSWIGEMAVPLWRKPSMLEAGVCCTLFPQDNWVSLWQEYTLSVIIFKREKHPLCANKHSSAELNKHVLIFEIFHLC